MRLEENEIQSLRVALKLTQAQKQQLKVTAEGCEYEKEVTQKYVFPFHRIIWLKLLYILH